MPTIPVPHTDAVANDVGEYTHFRLPDNSSLCTSNEISAFLGRVSQLVLNHFKKHPENVPSYLSSVSLDERSTFSLPKGYVLIRVPRISSMTNHVDKYIWGHPSGQKFRSTNEFAPHMISLITGSSACECVLCLGKMKRVKPSKANVEHEEVLEEGQAPPAKRRRHESYRVIDSDDDDQESSSVTRQSGSTNSSLNNESQRQEEDEESDFSEVDEMEDVFIQQAAEEMEDDDIQILISDEGDEETESDIADAIDTTFPKPQQAGSTSAAPAFRSSVSIPLSAPFFPSLPQPLMQQRAQHAPTFAPPPKPKSVTSVTSATAIRRPSNTQPTPKPPATSETRKPSKPASTDTNEPFKYKFHPHQLAWIRTYLLSDAVPPLLQTPASSSTTPKFIPPSFSHLTNPGNIVYWPCIVRDTMTNYIPSTTSDGPVRVIRPHSILSILEEEDDDAGGDIEVFAPSIPYTPSTSEDTSKKNASVVDLVKIELIGLNSEITVLPTELMPFSSIRVDAKVIQFMGQSLKTKEGRKWLDACGDMLVVKYGAAVWRSWIHATEVVRVWTSGMLKEPEMLNTVVPKGPRDSGQLRTLKGRSWRGLQIGGEVIHLGDFVTFPQSVALDGNKGKFDFGGILRKVNDEVCGRVRFGGTLHPSMAVMEVLRIEFNEKDVVPGDVSLFGYLCHLEYAGGEDEFQVKRSWIQTEGGSDRLEFVSVVCSSGVISKFHPQLIGMSASDGIAVKAKAGVGVIPFSNSYF